MPLSKEQYEKVIGRKLTDAEYGKLSGAAQQERPGDAYAGASLKDGRGTTAKKTSGYAYAKDAKGNPMKYVGGLNAVETFNTPSQLDHPASTGKAGNALAAEPMTEAERLRAELGGGAMTGYKPPPKPGPTPLQKIVTNNPVQPGMEHAAGPMNVAPGAFAPAKPSAGVGVPLAGVPITKPAGPTYAAGMTNTPGKATAASVAAAADDLPERAVDGFTDAVDDLGSPTDLYEAVIAAQRKKHGL